MANNKKRKKKPNTKPAYNKKGTNNKKNNKKKGLLIGIIAAVVVIAAIAIILTCVFRKDNKRKLLKSDATHVTVTGEQRLIQLCDMIKSGMAYTEEYETDGMRNYYTCDGTRNYNRATFTDESYSWDVSELFDGTTTYAIDYSNKTVSKYEITYEGVQDISMMGIYLSLYESGNLNYVGATEEQFEGKTCYVETYTQSSSLTGENTIKAYFYKDTLVAIETTNQYKVNLEYVEITEGADEALLTYTKPEGYTENF